MAGFRRQIAESDRALFLDVSIILDGSRFLPPFGPLQQEFYFDYLTSANSFIP
jgi:hypothetical protein